MPKVRVSQKNTKQEEAQVFPLSPTQPIKAKANKKYLCS